MLTVLVVRGLGVNWIEVVEFLIAVGGVIAVGYFVLIALRRR